MLQTKLASRTKEKESECETVVTPLDLVFLIDSSGSIEKNGANGHALSKQFVRGVVAGLSVGNNALDTRVAVVQFSTTPKTEIELSDGISKHAVEVAVNKMAHLNVGTCTGHGIKHVTFDTFKHARPDAAKMLVIIADGNSDDDFQGPADAARSQGIDVVAVGVGNKISRSELRKIVGSKIGDVKVLSVTDYGALSDILANTTEKICDEVSTPKLTPAPIPLPTPRPTIEPTLAPTPAPTPRPTWPPYQLARHICVENKGGYALDFWVPHRGGKTHVLLHQDRCIDLLQLGLAQFQTAHVYVDVVGDFSKARSVLTVSYYAHAPTVRRTCTGTTLNWRC